MRFDVVTIFPEWFSALRSNQIWSRAEQSKLLELEVHDLRGFTADTHRTVDDVPYGGGPGMVLKVEPLVRAVESVGKVEGGKILYASPQGRKLDQAWAAELSKLPQIIIIAGRYEGVDERFVEGWVDESFSIGDYVLSGGELPALVLIEAVARMIPGVVGDWGSVTSDSFFSGGLKYPQYTRPAAFRGREVPEVLRSGNHRQIERWRKAMSVQRTIERRPDLMPVGSTGEWEVSKQGEAHERK